MRQKVLALAAGLSAVLCVAVLFFWVSSAIYLGWRFTLHHPHGNNLGASNYHLEVAQGGLMLEETGYTVATDLSPSDLATYRSAWSEGTSFQWQTATFNYPSTEELFGNGRWIVWSTVPGRPETEIERGIVAPCWLLAILTGILPLWWIVSRRRRTAMPRHASRCKQCGYDLRATPERCPECGAVPAGRA